MSDNRSVDPVLTARDIRQRALRAVMIQSLAEEAMRATMIMAALENSHIPLDTTTLCALDQVQRHLEASLDAADQAAVLEREG